MLQAHIAEIFRSKFSDFQNFDTMLYTCAKEFDFIETEVSVIDEAECWVLLLLTLISAADFPDGLLAHSLMLQTI